MLLSDNAMSYCGGTSLTPDKVNNEYKQYTAC